MTSADQLSAGPPAAPAPAQVVVVDDSPVQRRFVRAALEAAPDLTVVGEARNGREAVALVARLRPAAVLMDLDLPVMGGIEAIEQIMASSPTPILVYSAFVGGTDSRNALEALAAGAVDVLAKPQPGDTGSLDELAAALRVRMRVCARARVITHPRGRLRQAGHPSPAVVPAATRHAAALAGAGAAPRAGAAAGAPAAGVPAAGAVALGDPPAPRCGIRLVAVGASTGGPQALLALLSRLPADLEQAVVVVQHMADGFVPGLAAWLDGLVAPPVVVGASGHRLAPGTVTLAPSGGNLLVQDERLRVLVTPPEPGQFHVPGVDATFRSVADALGPAAVGVLLTGMGRDGALGLQAMQSRGAATLGQDEATSAVYGMPAAAHALGAVDQQLPLDQIGPALLALLGRLP